MPRGIGSEPPEPPASHDYFANLAAVLDLDGKTSAERAVRTNRMMTCSPRCATISYFCSVATTLPQGIDIRMILALALLSSMGH